DLKNLDGNNEIPADRKLVLQTENGNSVRVTERFQGRIKYLFLPYIVTEYNIKILFEKMAHRYIIPITWEMTYINQSQPVKSEEENFSSTINRYSYISEFSTRYEKETYMKDDKSPEKYLSTLLEKGVSFKKTEIKQTKENYPFKELISVFEIDVIDECGSSGEIEKTILRSWCTWAKENEPFGWVSIKPRRLPYLISKTKRVTEIKDAKFCVGGFKSPTKFCQHFPELPCSIIFEYDTDILTILFSCDSKNSIRFELSTKTIINSVVIKAQDQELFFCIETSERFKLTILTGGNKVARTNLGSNLSKHFGLSSVIQISFPDETLDVALEIIAYLKRKGITVVYADIQLTKSCNSLDELNRTVQFIDFETEYAWQSLLHRGYKVIDAIEKDIIEIFKENKNSNFADRFFEMESLVDNNIFFCFEHNWKEASKPKEVEYDNHENLESNTLYVRRIVVTPTSEIYFKKEPTKQNRVLLQYKADFFLRVVFRDEDFKKMQLLSKEPEKGSLVERIKQFLIDGIRIGDRHFEFLGNSNSQLREHGAWLVAEHDGFTAESIRKSLGDFTKERCIASYVSRLGLCFSSSMKTVDISTALQVSQPSALQIRYAGCKGVIAFDPELGEEEQLVVRDSMVKFQSPSKTLEILQWTRPGQLFLNRQVITLMSGLGVPDRAFLILQQNVLMDLANMLIDEERAFDELTSVLKNIQYEKARKNGLLLRKEPFFRSILITIYKYRVDGILKKSRIPIHWSKGRIMMGTVDETRTLNYGEVFISYSNKCEASKCKVVVYTGSVVVAKNPCFHPGDLRKFKAVDIPKLHHMVDCIVFPQKGHRPHPDEMSGSDLDGDMYFVCWDQSFIPPNKNETPMDFPKAAKKKLQREIRVGDVVDFFGDYIKNDRLGVIANAHVVHADMESIFSEACLELAKMHSYAVDFPKTGHIPEISKDLTVEKYPDFMMKKDKPVYTSEKILGKLFRQCEFISKIINRSSHIDLIIENAIAKPEFLRHGYKIFSKDAQMVLNVYTKKISNLMNQYGIKTEAELFTGMLMSMKTQRGCLENETFEITEMIQTKLSKICRDTRNEFFKEFGGEQNAKRNLESVHAKASAWYMASYGAHNLSLRCLSFPWLVAEFVVSKTGQQDIIGFEQSGYTEIGSTVEKHVLERLKYVEQKMHEEMGLSYVNIGMLKDGCPVLHAYGPYDKLKDMQWLLDSTAQFDSLLINTPARDMIVIRNSVIFTFEGCSGKDDLLEYNLYKGDCNEHHKTLPLAIPSLQRIKTNKKIIDCQVFMQTCMKQIETTSKVYNQLFHGDMLISIVFGRLYLNLK
ncbi:hypothetical protein KUTeg_007473, partial [Tegillarca granosa]